MKYQTKDTFKIYWRHAAGYKMTFIFLSLSLTLGSVVDIYKPFLYRDLFNTLAHQIKASGKDPATIILEIAGVSFIGWFFWRIAGFIYSYFEPRVMTDLLNTCFDSISNRSYAFFNNNFSGSLVRRAGRYPEAFEAITDQLLFSISGAVIRIGAVLVILYIHYWALATVVLVWSIMYMLVNYWFAVYKMRFNVRRAQADTNVTAHLSDVITNNLNLKLFGGVPLEIRTFTGLTEILFKLRRISWNMDAIAEGIQAAFMIILEFLVLWTALKYWRMGKLLIGDFVLLQAYLILIFDQLWNFGRVIQRIYRSIADAEEMTEILLTPYEVKDSPDAGSLQVPKGEIVFNNVTFGYHTDKPVFRNFNMSIAPGEKVALIGASGGGKTTIVKLLFRFFDIENGEILIDGQNIAKVSQESLRSKISLVPQEPVLFHRSLIENIRYARPDATDEEVIEAAKLAHCHEFIVQFPEQYQTFVGERGVKLSGGERQRVAIARAILKNAPILVLDEATSSLDSESERYIQASLRELMKNKTTIVIAHRLSTVMQMNRILVLEEGNIIEEGDHYELLKIEDGTYQRLWDIQAGGFANKAEMQEDAI